MSVRDKNKVLKIFFAFFFMSVLMGKGVSVHAEAPQYAYETKFVVDADNAFCWCDASHKVWGELTAYRTQLIVKSVCWVDTTGKDCQTGTIGEKVLTFVVLEVKLFPLTVMVTNVLI